MLEERYIGIIEAAPNEGALDALAWLVTVSMSLSETQRARLRALMDARLTALRANAGEDEEAGNEPHETVPA